MSKNIVIGLVLLGSGVYALHKNQTEKSKVIGAGSVLLLTAGIGFLIFPVKGK